MIYSYRFFLLAGQNNRIKTKERNIEICDIKNS